MWYMKQGHKQRYNESWGKIIIQIGQQPNRIVMKSIQNLTTQRSVQINQSTQFQLPQAHKQEQLQFRSESQSQRQFSFNRQLRSQQESMLKDKYGEIYNDLRIMDVPDLVQLLLQELDENQRCKKEIVHFNHRVQAMEDQLVDLREALKKKREAIALLCETESKNLQLIQKLQNKISKKNEYGRDTHYQKKYQQLSVYMNQYIRNINLAQQQFKKAYSALKTENSRLLHQVQKTSNECSQIHKKHQILKQKIKRYQNQISELGETKTRLSSSLNIIAEENQILKKQIQIFQENIRITDRLQVHIEKEHHQLSSDLDFIRQKICENQNISRDIIEKLEESSSNCERVSKDKEKFFQSLQRSKDRCTLMERQNAMLKKKNEQLEQDLKILKKEFDFVVNERDEIDDDLMQEKLEKESIRKQLLSLAEKVRLMESTYRKQIEQSEKIKGELYKFWQNKQKKECAVKQMSHSKVLSELKPNNYENSQTTLSISEKQSKLSLWHKKSDYEASSNMQEKQNQDHHLSKDSLCD